MVLLRDMRESDIEDYVRWFTVETEFFQWDAPWEEDETTEEAERASWTEYYHKVRDLPPDRPRWKFEIEADGMHIGWVSAYTDLGYLDNPEEFPAIGIDIPRQTHRRSGNGTEALTQFIDYLKQAGHKVLYTQTWSGNYPMIGLAEKLGFKEFARLPNLRMVKGKPYDAITFRLEL